MSAAYINGSWSCYALEGRTRHYLGCSHERPRQAIAHTSPTPYVSPLRASIEASTADSVVPPSGSRVRSDASVELPSGDSGPRGRSAK